jgi:hypothetical protein
MWRMRGRTAGTELSLVVAAILLGLNFVAIKIAVVSIPRCSSARCASPQAGFCSSPY